MHPICSNGFHLTCNGTYALPFTTYGNKSRCHNIGSMCALPRSKPGPPEHAKSHWPISASTGMYSILAKLVFNAIREPIDVSLSNLQARSWQGHTTSRQALRMSMLMHAHDEQAIVRLLDTAKAYPSIPHQCLLEGLRILGAPSHIPCLWANNCLPFHFQAVFCPFLFLCGVYCV